MVKLFNNIKIKIQKMEIKAIQINLQLKTLNNMVDLAQTEIKELSVILEAVILQLT